MAEISNPDFFIANKNTLKNLSSNQFAHWAKGLQK